MQIDPAPKLDGDDVAALRAASAPSAPRRWASLRAHWRAWLPILMRAVATGLALLGLAGIGLAARGSSELPALARAPRTFGWAQMLGASPLAMGPAVARPAPAPGEVGRGELAAGEVAASSGVVQRCSCEVPLPCASSSGTAPPSVAPHVGRADASSEVTGALLADGRMVLNRAGLLELQRLPGIGAKRAASILELRGRLGRFARISDLLRVKGIGRRTLERLSPQLVLDAPPAPAPASAAPAAR